MPFPYPEQAHRPRQGADRRRPGEAGRLRAATRMWTATASATARCPAPIIPPRPTSRAAAATTTQAQYSEREDDYINNMDRLARKFEAMRKHVPAPVVEYHEKARDRLRRAAARRTTRSKRAATSCARIRNLETSYLRLKAYPFTAGAGRISSAATSACTWSTRIATGSCWR